MNNVAGIFHAITYVFIIVGFIDIGITLYIIFYKNIPVIEVAANVCYHCATKALPLVGALHVSSNVPFISQIQSPMDITSLVPWDEVMEFGQQGNYCK